ncbi:winged helix-turn-helix domain-containing protein [Klebsiella oxytoca]|uniref:winged helix-turn-helix domain-containing protein n=1 Tax=Klebsiella oxytoca TaxID=571 RepID=UPI001CD036AA|nr:helix-turn-helix domain-containing protein [Klebsiella oxytoca]MBZ7307780.1 winged helix-turn-helix domain-containing protein [Klebsiella oxytoca]HEC2068923.1 winged helix-turn-helix domain-containing protein [Klebsiella oxytoca]
MKYLIESKLFYNAESGELIYIDIGVTEKHQLTKTANHILAILMASHGKVVSRQSFLEQVWESRGHEASNSSLNQYISILRKKLSLLIRKDNIILTSPGVGFYLSKDIKVKRYDDASQEGLPSEKLRQQRFRYLKHGGVVALIASLIIVFFARYEVAATSILAKSSNNLEEIGKCQIRSYVQIPESMQEKLLNILVRHHPGLLEHCQSSPARLIIYAQRNVLQGKSGGVFSSFCPMDSVNKKIIYCNNVYVSQWRQHD